MRRDAALIVLRDSGIGQGGEVPAPLVGLLDASAVHALRTIVRGSADPHTFNYAAAAFLAHLGDTDILADLQTRQQTFRATGTRYGQALDWYVWQIQQQNPPTQLLTHIASAELFTPQSRAWALRRAVEIGLPGADIRQAILTYASVGRPFGPDRLAAGLQGLKAVGSQLGVLAPDDLPNVPGASGSRIGATQTVLWDLNTPGVAWQPPWEPRWENFGAFWDWSRTRPWAGLSREEANRLVSERACELELIPPERCP